MIKKINKSNFKPYGWVVEFPDKALEDKKKNLFCVVLQESSKLGWRIAYLVLRERKIFRLERHPGSFESFEPVKGKSLLYVCNKKDLGQIVCFYLDKPVILKKGLWHGVVALEKEAEIKITENAQVKCLYWDLGFYLPSK